MAKIAKKPYDLHFKEYDEQNCIIDFHINYDS